MLQSSAGQPGDGRKVNTEALSNNAKSAQELRTALKQAVISTKDVPMTDGYKRNLRHEIHNLHTAVGALAVFAILNFAHMYAVPGGAGGPVERIADDIMCRFSDDA